MPEVENLGSFFTENKKLIKDYVDVHLELYKLRLIQIFSKTAGYMIWIIISLFLLLLFSIFAALVLGLWLSDITGSYIIGFGITTAIIGLKIVLITAFRKKLFVNPIIRNVIRKMNDDDELSGN